MNIVNQEDALKEKARKKAILNPPPPKRQFDAIKSRNATSFRGQRVEAGAIVPIWPTDPPKGFVTKEDAEELVNNGYADPASDEEVEAFLAANNHPTA